MKITISATDIGQITWSKNVLTAQDTLLPKPSQFNYGGITSWNMAQQANHMFNDSGLIKFKPGNSYTTFLPSKFRIGIGYEFTKRFAAGADIVMPLNNKPTNLENAYFAVGAKLELASNLHLNFGLAGNSTYGFSLPFGVTLGHFFKVMELSVATNDLLTYFNHGSNPNISLAMAIFRLNIDKSKK